MFMLDFGKTAFVAKRLGFRWPLARLLGPAHGAASFVSVTDRCQARSNLQYRLLAFLSFVFHVTFHLAPRHQQRAFLFKKNTHVLAVLKLTYLLVNS